MTSGVAEAHVTRSGVNGRSHAYAASIAMCAIGGSRFFEKSGERDGGTSDANAPAMNIRFIAFSLLALSVGCSSSSSAPDAPVIDSLDVPATTTSLTLNGQTGPGVILTLSAHDSSAGISALHVVFTETSVDHPIPISGNPTTIQDQKIELIALGAPSGTHPLSIYLTNVNGASSTVIAKSITVP